MPKRTDLRSILIIGAGPIVIGQACEFDYSGAQACKALKAEGFRVVLVNSNPATIMTDPDMADATYIEPLHWTSLAKIIEKERPDAVLPTMGGQTALNAALDLADHGVLEKFGVELIGASREAIKLAEDRELFRHAMAEIGLECPRAEIARSLDQALAAQKVGYPTIIRPSFTLGGSGGGIAYNREEFVEIVSRGLDLSPVGEVLIEESVLGWKEYEMEVVRDRADNCIIVCSIENFDPMGVHTGDSITVAPAQTLTDREYQRMRDASRSRCCARSASTPAARTCSSASMRGRPHGRHRDESAGVALVGAGVEGHGLPDRQDRGQAGRGLHPGRTAQRHHRRPDAGLVRADHRLRGHQDPALRLREVPQGGRAPDHPDEVGGRGDGDGPHLPGVAAEGAARSWRPATIGLNPRCRRRTRATACDHSSASCASRGPERIFYVADAFRAGMSVARCTSSLRHRSLVPGADRGPGAAGARGGAAGPGGLDACAPARAQAQGLFRLAPGQLVGTDEGAIRALRRALGIRPVYKRVDSCAAEFATSTAYMYSTYEEECEAAPTNRDKIVVLGGGPNRIGQGIEFDYCCVHAALALREDGFETIMVNCNPETVSTDYDTSDRLYFEPVTLEDVLEILDKEKPKGVVVQYGGQTPLKLARALEKEGAPIIGTYAGFDRPRRRPRTLPADDRPTGPEAAAEPHRAHAGRGGRAGARDRLPAGGAPELRARRPRDGSGLRRGRSARYMTEAVRVSNDSPVLLDRFLDHAGEIDVDCICDGRDVMIGGIMEHIEEAGVHSGDSPRARCRRTRCRPRCRIGCAARSR
jgi:carbamoyl-phosphate synthase large subunit